MDSVSSDNHFSNAEVSIEELPRFEEVNFYKISSKKLIKTNIQISLCLLLFVVGWGVLYIYEQPTWLLVVCGITIAGLFGFAFCNAILRQKRYGYALREKDLIFRRGYWHTKTTIIPFNRVQHVSTSQGILDKFLNIANLNVFTAGGQGSDIRIPGLSPNLANQLKTAIAMQITEEIENNA